MALSLFRFIAAVSRIQVVSNSLGTFAMLLVLLLGGFIVAKDDIVSWMKWGYYISPLMYGQNSIAVNEFLDERWNDSQGIIENRLQLLRDVSGAFRPGVLTALVGKKDEHKRLPPGPKRLPIIGNLHQLSQPIHQTFRSLSNKHGPLMFLQLGSFPTLVVSSADMAREVLKTHDLTFASRPTLYATNKISYNGTSISLAPYGKYWREVRKIALMELLSPKRVESFESVRKEEVAYIINIVADSSAKSATINLTELMFMVVNNIVLRAIFSKKMNYGEEKGKSSISKFSEVIDDFEELMSVGNIADSFPWMRWYNKFNGVEERLEKGFRALDSFYDMVIREHRHQRSEHEDLVDVLLRIQNDPNQEIKLTDDNIKGVLTDMFLAGSDTSSTTLVWIMAELMKNPSAMRKAQEEVRAVVKEKDGAKAEDLDMEESSGIAVHKKTPLYVLASTPSVAI
ncbi:Premnaspirodiene oxygenase [Heracleum sosnowskyi]|uniref:Premnaspirodiene oxygenase n=1 Tax=Heracleum sosnowskyi TaxID=360622 RepID=A0AAD8I9V0_9APIA|nr:Premnaspirodiene oxygenase [Heracleum sosnowskyi]